MYFNIAVFMKIIFSGIPGNSREMADKFPGNRLLIFPGKLEALISMLVGGVIQKKESPLRLF